MKNQEHRDPLALLRAPLSEQVTLDPKRFVRPGMGGTQRPELPLGARVRHRGEETTTRSNVLQAGDHWAVLLTGKKGLWDVRELDVL